MKLSKATNNSSNTIAGISATDLRNGITKISQEPLTSVSLSLGIFPREEMAYSTKRR